MHEALESKVRRNSGVFVSGRSEMRTTNTSLPRFWAGNKMQVRCHGSYGSEFLQRVQAFPSRARRKTDPRRCVWDRRPKKPSSVDVAVQF